MATAAYIVAGLAVAGAVVCWIAGAVFYLRTPRTGSDTLGTGSTLRALIAWPFARSRLQGEATAQAANVNKALVAFFACLVVAVSAISVATNLARVSR